MVMEMEMDLDRIYGGQLLRNFQVDFLQSTLTGFFDSKTTFNRVWKENLCENGWLKASDLIEKCDVFNSKQSLIRLEEIFYDELVNNVSDHTHLYPISLRDQSLEEIKRFFMAEQLPFDLKINRYFRDQSSFQTINVKITDTKITFLFRLGLTNDEDDKNVVFIIPCVIDLANQLIQIKYKKLFRSKSTYPTKDILAMIINYIEAFNIIDVNYFNPSFIKSIYFRMFKDESERAEQIIKNRTGVEAIEIKQEEAKKYIHDILGITEDNSEHVNTYIQKIMSIYYHHQAIQMEDTDFGDRYMFAFSFYDGNATRSTTRNSDKNHVYTGNLYWTLKDIILQKEKISSISMFYRFNPANFLLITEECNIGVEINFKESSSLRDNKAGFLIEYLNTDNRRRDGQRGVKNEYIVSEVKRYLSTSPNI